MPSKDLERRRETNRKSMARWYERNKDLQIQRNRDRKDRIRQWIQDYKAQHGCAHCGERHPACLDLHHKEPSEKEYNVGSVFAIGWKIERIQSELDKCIILCANCHRKLHWTERNIAG